MAIRIATRIAVTGGEATFELEGFLRNVGRNVRGKVGKFDSEDGGSWSGVVRPSRECPDSPSFVVDFSFKSFALGRYAADKGYNA
jgi:hypothetical protein